MREINRIVLLSSIADKATDKHEPFEINFKYNALIDFISLKKKGNITGNLEIRFRFLRLKHSQFLYLEFHLGQYTLQIHIDKINSIRKYFHDNVRRLHYSHCST